MKGLRAIPERGNVLPHLTTRAAQGCSQLRLAIISRLVLVPLLSGGLHVNLGCANRVC